MQSPRLSWCEILFKKKQKQKQKNLPSPCWYTHQQQQETSGTLHGGNYLKRVMRDCLGCLIVESGKNHANGNMLRKKRFPFFCPTDHFPSNFIKPNIYQEFGQAQWAIVCLFLTSQQHASVSQRWICSDNFTCCHSEIEVADQTFHFTQSQYTDNGPTGPSADPIMPGAWQGSHWSANFYVTGMTRSRKSPGTCRIWTRDLPLLRRMP